MLVAGMLTAMVVAMLLAHAGHYVSHRWIVAKQAGSAPLMSTSIQVLRISAALLSFLVALTFSRVSQNRERLTENVEVEAAQLNDIYEDSGRLPGDEREELSQLLLEYTRSLVVDEWEYLAEGMLSPKTEALFQKLEGATLDLPADSPRAVLLQGRMLQDLDEISDLRQERLHRSQAALPGFFLLVSIGYVMVAMLMGVQKLERAQCIFFSLGAAFVGAVLFLIVSMSNTCGGPMAVAPKAFVVLLERLDSPSGIDAGQPSGAE